MKVAALEKFGRGGDGDQDPGDPGVGKVKGGGEDFFPFKQEKVGGRGGMALDDTVPIFNWGSGPIEYEEMFACFNFFNMNIWKVNQTR